MQKKTVVLINFPPALDFSYVNRGMLYPSTALMLIGTVLKRNGYDPRIIDGAYHEDYRKRLIDILSNETINILYIGMSVMVTQIPFALEASKIAKRINKKIPVIWGGPHPTLYARQTLENENVDIVSINEGTYTALFLARALESGQFLDGVKGIGYKNGRGKIYCTDPAELEGISSLPHFDFSLIETNNYVNPQNGSVYEREFPQFNEKLKIMPILTGLGCPYRCQFCINVILKRKYRHRSAALIVEEIKFLQAHYDANTFLFLDEDFFVNKKRLLEFISLVEKENLHFNGRMWCRVDHFRDSYINGELLRRFNKIGCFSLVMGGESGDNAILKDLKKGITSEQIMNSLNILKGFDSIFSRYSFMVGLENETSEQIKRTYRFCMNMKKINPMVDIAGPFVFRLYPGSPIYNRLVANYSIQEPDSLEKWSEEVTNYGSKNEIPWTPQWFQRDLKYLIFYSMYALSFFKTDIKHLKSILRLLLALLSKIRMKNFFFFLPFEYWMYSAFHRRKIELS